MLRVGILFATCVLASTFAAAQEPDLNQAQKVTQVAGNVYKLVGPVPVPDDGNIANIAACFGEDGIVLVDVEQARFARTTRSISQLGPGIICGIRLLAVERSPRRAATWGGVP